MFFYGHKNVAALLIGILLSCIGSVDSYAQKQQVRLRMTDTIPEVTNEALQDVTIQVENTGSEVFRGSLHLYCGKGARIASKQDLPVTVAPGKSLYVAAKVYIGAATLAGNIPYSAQLFDLHNTRIAETTAQLHLAPSRLMQAAALQADIRMPEPGGQLRIPVSVSNRGNTLQKINVVIAYPSELQDAADKSIQLDVPAFTDTIVYFSRKVTRTMYKMEYMDISVYGVYSSGDYFSISPVAVQSIRSNKRYGRREQSLFNRNATNFVSAGIQNAFSDNESYSLQGKGDYALKDGRVAFSLNVFRWKASGMPTLINDTWLGLEYKGFGIKVGNVIQNGELNYNGRGAEVYYYMDTLRRRKVYAGYLDKSFNLVNSQNGNASFGRAAWAGYQQEAGKLRNNTMVSYDEDNYARSRSMIVVNEAGYQLNELLFAGFKAGAATSVSSDETEEHKESLSLGASLNGNLSKTVSISSDNVYASGYYPGTRRGTLALNERLNIRIGKSVLSAGYMYNYIDPLYFSRGGTSFRSNNRSTAAELSWAYTLGKVNFSLAPQYYHELGNWYQGGNTVPGDMKALRLSTSFAFADMASRQNLLLRTDFGRYTTDFMDKDHWQFRANLSYSFRFFRLNANIQQGNFFLSEAFQEQTGGMDRLRVNISPAVSASFFENRLRTEAGVTYYRDFFTSSLLYNAHVSYSMNTTRVFGTLQYNTFASAASYRNLQFGITQLLPQQSSAQSSKGSIHLFVFYDLNGNSMYDATDSVAGGYMAAIGKVLLISGSSGHINYTRLPAASYHITFPTQQGWYSPDQSVLVKEKEEISLQVPLRQTGTVTGKISYEYDELYSYEVTKELAGQTIEAINEAGHSFRARTDDNGRYILYLPAGSYTINPIQLPTQIESRSSKPQPVVVTSGAILPDNNFQLKVRQRKIEIKKFGK